MRQSARRPQPYQAVLNVSEDHLDWHGSMAAYVAAKARIVAEGQRAAEVRFARFFNNTPVAIATLSRSGRVLRSNASFVRLFGTLPRTEVGTEGPLVYGVLTERDRVAMEAAIQASASSATAMPAAPHSGTPAALRRCARTANGWARG